MDFSLLTIPPLPEETLHAAPSLPAQEALGSPSGPGEVRGRNDAFLPVVLPLTAPVFLL